jgi:hypothetical protein
MIDRSGFIQVGRSSQARVIAASAVMALLACMVGPAAHATPSIKVLSEVAYDGPIKYTVKMASKNWGSAQETRTIRNVPEGCPDVDAIRNASGTTVRQVKIRFAAVVASSGDADVQLSFQGHAPRPAAAVTVGGKKLQCPTDNFFSQLVHFTMPTGGAGKDITLSDGTKLTISASRK